MTFRVPVAATAMSSGGGLRYKGISAIKEGDDDDDDDGFQKYGCN